MDIREIAAWATLGVVAAIGLTIVAMMIMGRIDLTRLVSEPNGDASMSRFQLLIFTFVIAFSFFLIVASADPPAFPADIPPGVLTLLGISATSYLVSKGIQFSKPEGVEDRPPVVEVSPSSVSLAPGTTQQFTVTVSRGRNKSVKWGLVPPGIGQIHPDTGLYTAPKSIEGAGKVVNVQAASVADANAVGTAVVNLVGSPPVAAPVSGAPLAHTAWPAVDPPARA